MTQYVVIYNFFFAILLGLATTATANSIIVMNINDSGDSSLRDAVTSAIAGDTILFDTGINGDTIRLTTGHILIDKNIFVIGNGSGNTVLDGNGTDRIFEISPDKIVSIMNITICNGGMVDDGGGIINGANLTISNCVITNNSSINRGGAIFQINSSSSLKVLNSTIQKNQSSSGGGICCIEGSLRIIISYVQGNSAIGAGAASGGGIYTSGFEKTAIIQNSIISGNICNSGTGESLGGGVYVGFGLSPFFNSSSIVGNMVSSQSNDAIGGGVYLLMGSPRVASFRNCVIAKNTDDGSGPDISLRFGFVSDSGNNHILSPDGDHGITSGNNIDPLFAMDVDTTGGIPTISGDLRLACGSSAIDAGTPDTTGLGLGLIDIAGLPRVQGGAIDIGAHERAIPCIELSDCSQDSITLDNTLLSNSDPLALFRAQTKIQVDAMLTRDISTKAGLTLLFNKNFTVNTGIIMEASIEECTE